MQLLAGQNLPARMLWGGAAAWEPVAEVLRLATTYPCVREQRMLPGPGHCPHDGTPERAERISG